MSASCIITSLSFILLLATICCELIAFLTSHVISNNFDSRLHEGIYQRCGMPFNSILGSQTNIGSYFGFTPACSWWNSRMFDFDPVSLRAVAILGFISFATLGIVFFVGLLSLADRLRTRGLQVFLGILMILNVAILVTIILVYTLVYAKDVKLISANEPLTFTNRVFSWSYWFLYAATGLSLITSVFLCFNPVRSFKQ